MKKYDTSTVLYEIEGNDISIEKAPAELIGNVLLNFQSLVFSLGQYFDPEARLYGRRMKSIEDKYKLKICFEEGSLVLEMSPFHDYQVLYPIEEFPQQKTQQEGVFYKLRELLDSLQDEEGDYRFRIETLMPEHRVRLRIFNYLNELLPKDGVKASITFFDSQEKTKTFEMNKEIIKKRVLIVLKEEAKEDSFEINGVIVRLKDDSPGPVFWIKTFDGKLSKINLPRERRAKVIKYLSERVPIRLLGVGAKKKYAEIVDIDAIEEYRELMIDHIGDTLLKEPIKAEISFEKYDKEDDFWVVSNEELGIVGVDKTVEKARKEFEEDLYEFYQYYKAIPDDKLSERTKKIKEKLIQAFELKT